MGKPSHRFLDPKTARHFAVVHRSVDDPLVFEERGSTHVLQEYVPRNVLKHRRRRGDQKGTEPRSQEDIEQNVGKAALYGVHYNDSDYDYTQHLKAIGTSPNGAFVSAKSEDDEVRKKTGNGGFQLKRADEGCASGTARVDLPESALPSDYKMDVQGEALPSGLQPYMDPDLREVLEALQDVDLASGDAGEGIDDDFLDKLNASDSEFSGEPEERDHDEYGSDENWGLAVDEDGHVDADDLFAHIRKLKQHGKLNIPSYDDDGSLESGSEDGRPTKQSGPRTIRSGYSMSSSAMYRNEKLTLLDDQFDRIEQEYYQDYDSDNDEDGGELGEITGIDEAGRERKMVEYRQDLESMLDEFLGNYEFVGPKLVPKIGGDTEVEKLSTLRNVLLANDKGAVESRKLLLKRALQQRIEGKDKSKDKVTNVDYIDMSKEAVNKRPAWDCETIISSYSTLENHPALIKDEAAPKIRISKKSGMPIRQTGGDEDETSDDSSCEEAKPKVNKGVARSKAETKEEKKARKAAIKEEKR
ncbi:Protein ltv1, partial [Spiromyces aspiralis]